MWYNGSRQVKLAGLCCFMPSFFMHKLFSLVNTYRKNIEKKAVMAMVSKKARQVVYILFIVTIFITGGCTNRQTEHIGLQEPTPTGHTATMYVANVSTLSNVPVYRESGGLVWVPLEETAKSMNYDLHYANGCFAMGGTDAAYSVNMNQTRAMAGDMPVELPQAPKYIDHKPHLTTQALSALFGVPVNWNGERSQVIFSPIDDRRLSDRQNTFPLEQSETETLRAAGISVNKNDLIRFAEVGRNALSICCRTLRKYTYIRLLFLRPVCVRPLRNQASQVFTCSGGGWSKRIRKSAAARGSPVLLYPWPVCQQPNGRSCGDLCG